MWPKAMWMQAGEKQSVGRIFPFGEGWRMWSKCNTLRIHWSMGIMYKFHSGSISGVKCRGTYIPMWIKCNNYPKRKERDPFFASMIMGGKVKRMAFSLKDPFVCPKKGIIQSYSGDGIWTINPTLGRSLDFLFGIFDMQWYNCYNI